MEAGQVIVGFSVSFTVTVKEQDAVPQILVAVTVTVVVPTLNKEPLPFPEPLPEVAPLKVYVRLGAGAPVTAVLKVTVVPQTPVVLFVTILAGQIIVGTAFTSTVAVMGAPVQPLNIGMIVNVTVTGVVVVLNNVPVISPVPLAVIPVTEALLSLVQLNVVPMIEDDSRMSEMLPEHMVCVTGVAIATGRFSFTVTVTVNGVPTQPPILGVTVKVTVTGALVVFVSVPLISPLPTPGIPVTVARLSRVQSKLMPGTFPVNRMGLIAVSEQTVCNAGLAVPVGTGLTEMVNLSSVPGQAGCKGDTAVTVMIAVSVLLPALIAVNDGIFPVPLAARPMDGLLLVQS